MSPRVDKIWSGDSKAPKPTVVEIPKNEAGPVTVSKPTVVEIPKTEAGPVTVLYQDQNALNQTVVD